jgi:asparagine synthase (glutamine-hydrolysing)
MCGIVGFTEKNPIVLADMIENIAHRGPDAYGKWESDKCSLGSVRLKIQDLEHGAQPCSWQDVHLIYNGELYGFKDDDSRMNDYDLKSAGDTAYLLKSYLTYGHLCLHRFNGQFAFAIWDGRNNELTLARDRLGIKPLYYFRGKNSVVFASEISGLTCHPDFSKEINQEAVGAYLTYGYIPAPYTIYKNVFEVVPGSYITFRDGILEEKQYYNSFDLLGHDHGDVDLVSERLTEAIVSRIPEEVNYGVMFSGGTDSTLVAAKIKDHVGAVDTYSIKFECKNRNWVTDQFFDESVYAKDIAKELSFNHHEISVRSIEVGEVFKKVVRQHGEPFFDTSSFPFYILSKVMREDGKKVAIGGEGGDEIFCGYYNSSMEDPRPHFTSINQYFSSGLSMFNWDLINYPLDDFVLNNKFNVEGQKWTYVDRCFRLKGHDLNNSMSVTLLDTFLRDDLLVKGDRMASAHGLEYRVPLLDHDFIKYAMAIDSKVRCRGQKAVLKDMLSKYLPDHLVNRRKKGFSIPSNIWLYYDFSWMVNWATDEKLIKSQGIFDYKLVNQLVSDFRETCSWQHCIMLWALIMFQGWYQYNYMEIK